MRVNGLKESQTVKASGNAMMEQSVSVSGVMVNLMDSAFLLGQIALNTKESIKILKVMDMEHLPGQMVLLTVVSTSSTKRMALANIYFQTKLSMKGNTKMTRCMVKENYATQMEA